MSLKIKGFEKLERKLKSLPKAAAKRVLTKMMRAGVKPVLKTMRQNIPEDEGLTRRTLTSKVGGKGLNKYGVIGADVAKLEALAGVDEKEPGHRPSNIDLLLDQGHVAPDGTFVPGTDYIARTREQAGPAAVAAMLAKGKSEIEREMTK